MLKEKNKLNTKRVVIIIVAIITSPIWLYGLYLIMLLLIVFSIMGVNEISEPFARKHSKSIVESKVLGVFIKSLNYKLKGNDSSANYEFFIEKGYKRSFWNSKKIILLEHDDRPYNFINTIQEEYIEKHGGKVSVDLKNCVHPNHQNYYFEGTFWKDGNEQVIMSKASLVDTVTFEINPYYQDSAIKTKVVVWETK